MDKRMYVVSIGLDENNDGQPDSVEMARMEYEDIVRVMNLWGDGIGLYQIVDINGNVVTFWFKNVTSISVDKDLGEV